MGAPDRLAELLGALSLASDRARGQAPEAALGATILSTRLARHVGSDPEHAKAVFYGALLRTLGCTSVAMEAAAAGLGDDLSLSYALHMSDLADAASVRASLQLRFAPTAMPDDRASAIDQIVDLRPQLARMSAPIDEQAVALSRRLPLPAGVVEALACSDARWDGANPTKPAGSEIPLAVRIVELASVAELYRRAGGVEAAVGVVAERAGGQLDPTVCAAFGTHAPELFDGFDAPSLWERFLTTEPEPVIEIDAPLQRLVAEIGADFADNKSGWFVGHSRRVAMVALAACDTMGVAEDETAAIVVAALLHDIGRCAVPNGVWDKPGPLTERELALARSHSRHTEEILSASAPLRSIARLAASAHERTDGKGYPHGSPSRDALVNVLAASDVYVALRSDRPWREACSEDATAEILAREADRGHLGRAAVLAVLEVCGQRRTPGDHRPDGLTRREVEVLKLLAQGLLTKQIAARLGIAYKTVDNHVQNLYRKIGASTRTAAAMYAVERGIYAD